MTLPVRHGHVSGRYDADPQHVADYAAKVSRGADILTLTEMYERRFVRALRRTLGRRTWRVTWRGEYVVATRREVFRVVPGRGQYRRLSRAFAGRDSWRDLYVYGRTIVHRETRRRIFVTVGHLASGVESGDGWRTDGSARGNVRANSTGAAAWGDWLRDEHARKPRRAQSAAMDCNRNQRSDFHRNDLTKALGLPSMWADGRPAHGTHEGGRLIDTIHSDLPFGQCWVVMGDKPADMDHRAVVANYRIEAA